MQKKRGPLVLFDYLNFHIVELYGFYEIVCGKSSLVMSLKF